MRTRRIAFDERVYRIIARSGAPVQYVEIVDLLGLGHATTHGAKQALIRLKGDGRIKSDGHGWTVVRRGSAKPNSGKNVWRKMQIILEPELVEHLYQWHSGQGSSVYALASTGMNNLVSLSMIDAAGTELSQDLKRTRGKDLKHLKETAGELAAVRQYWQEYSADQAGMDIEEYVYDRRDYGLSAEEEAEMSTKSG